jgi:YbgC/YbaW family acyl-CoA thioester hydrolase
MKRTDFRFTEPLRVRWAEVDAQGIVFNAHYLSYVDTAMSGYWRALALPYAATMQQLGGDLFVRHAALDYRAPARNDDRLDVGLKVREFGRSSMKVDAAIYRGDELLVLADMVYVFATPDGAEAQPVPDALRRVVQAFEAGQPVVDVAVGGWQDLGEAAGAIRREVFIEEQRIPAELEWDEADAHCLHAVAKVGRMAVLRPMRGSRVGRMVLEALLLEAQRLGYREVLLHAQITAEGFYRRAGFAPRGERFDEAGIAHIEMVRAI